MKKWTQSRIIRFNAFMAAVQTANGSIAAFEPFFDGKTFALIVVLMGIAQSVGNVYLRFQTAEAIGKPDDQPA